MQRFTDALAGAGILALIVMLLSLLERTA